ncbi:MAG TPA: tetratricopeptide repeat protein [Xanthobacteraceae bacterium]|nr:tetratricopeptide repeat protein [Xanthobacteraceae bacterium]
MDTAVSGGHSGALTPDIARLVEHPTACRIARIHLLGPMRATSYLGDDILPRGKKARALLALLCLASGEKLPRIRLARMLWDQASDELARGSLRHALLEVCAALGPLAAELISTGRATIRLDANACWIDAVALRESSAPDSERADLALFCAGKLLDGLDGVSASFDRWLARERDRFKWKTRGLRQPKTARASSDVKHDGPPRFPPRTETHAHQHLPGRNRLRVAVLPFEGKGEGKGAERGEDFAFSLSHDIAAGLARFRWFDVVAPVSFIYRPLDNYTGEHLLQRKELDYAVDGAVGRHGRFIEIDVRLLDLSRRTEPVWSERFELQASELHRLNEMVTGRVVGSIDPVTLFIEGQPNRRERYGATGLLLLAIPLLFSVERTKYERAGVLIHRAMEIDPKNATAPAWAAFWHITRVGQGWTQDVAGALATAETLCRKAIEIDPDNAEALGFYAHTCLWKKDFDAAIRYYDRSLRLNPNLAFIWALSAPAYCYIGEPIVALQRLKRYRELAPFDPYFWFEGAYALAYFFKGDYEQAVLVGRGAVKSNPNFSAGYKPLIAALGHLRRPDEAKPYIAKLLSLEPHFTVEHFAKTYAIKRANDRRRYMRGLLLAGVPAR